MEIDLNNYKPLSVKVLSGREAGKDLRRKLNLDSVDLSDEVVIVKVPDALYSINSSYFLGAFGVSVRALGEQQFRKRYTFQCSDIIRRNIEDGISRALKDSDVLGS